MGKTFTSNGSPTTNTEAGLPIATDIGGIDVAQVAVTGVGELTILLKTSTNAVLSGKTVTLTPSTGTAQLLGHVPLISTLPPCLLIVDRSLFTLYHLGYIGREENLKFVTFGFIAFHKGDDFPKKLWISSNYAGGKR